MQLTSILLSASLATVAVAHTRVYGDWINGQFQGANKAIRQAPTNNPVKDLTSAAMACNVNNNAVSDYLSVKTGDTFGFEWFHDARGDDIIASSHKGPVQVYIAPASSNGQGSVWVKIFSTTGDGQAWRPYNPEHKVTFDIAVDQLISAKGKHSITIPDVPAGNYLLRAEVLGLHEADVAYTSNAARGIQVYPSCSQITVTSNGSNTLPSGVAFPGAYTASTPGIIFNVWSPTTPGAYVPSSGYTAPGPAVWSAAKGGSIG